MTFPARHNYSCFCFGRQIRAVLCDYEAFLLLGAILKTVSKPCLSEKIPCFWANGQTSPARQGERSAENRNGFPVFRRLAVRVRARLVGGFDALSTHRRQNRGGNLTGTGKGLFGVSEQIPRKNPRIWTRRDTQEFTAKTETRKKRPLQPRTLCLTVFEARLGCVVKVRNHVSKIGCFWQTFYTFHPRHKNTKKPASLVFMRLAGCFEMVPKRGPLPR